MIFNLNFYVLMASDAFYGFPGPSRPDWGAGGPGPKINQQKQKIERPRVDQLKYSDKYRGLFQIIITLTDWTLGCETKTAPRSTRDKVRELRLILLL